MSLDLVSPLLSRGLLHAYSGAFHRLPPPSPLLELPKLVRSPSCSPPTAAAAAAALTTGNDFDQSVWRVRLPSLPGKKIFPRVVRRPPAFFFSSLALNTGRILLGRRKRRRRRSFLSAGDERERGGEAKGGESGWEMGATCSFSTYWSTSESARGRGTNDSDRPLSAGCDPPAAGEQMTGGTHGVTWPRVAAACLDDRARRPSAVRPWAVSGVPVPAGSQG